MKMRLTRTIRCWKNSRYRLAMVKGSAKRLAVTLMALLLTMPSLAAAAPFSGTDAFKALKQERTAAGARLFWEGVLRRSAVRFPSKNEGARVGDWYLHPDGFALKIPDGMTPLSRYKGTEVMLVGGPDGAASFRTSISISTTQKDARLKTMTRENVVSLYSSQFSRFKLIDISRDRMFGVECVSLSFFAGNPQLLFRQCLFEKNGRSYVITLMAENSVKALPTAWEQFQTFCDSLFFVGTTNGAKVR